MNSAWTRCVWAPAALLAVSGLLVLGCDDTSEAGVTVLGADASRGVGGSGGEGGDLPIGGNGGALPVGGQGGDELPIGGGGGDIPIGGDGGGGGAIEGVCEPGVSRCVTQGADSYELCRGDAQWIEVACLDGYVCQFDGCLPDGDACARGDRVCINSAQPAVCNPGEGWVPASPCDEGDVCIEGRCASVACALAARDASYLGCDYLAVNLPNGADTLTDGPPGLVVANPDTVESAFVRILDPMGGVAQLVDRIRVEMPDPNLVGPLPAYPIQTVSSQIRDGAGQIVADNLASADWVEIPPGGIATFLLPHQERPIGQSWLRRTAFRVLTDHPVAVYQFSPYCCNYSFSNDASLLFPTTSLGTEYRFVGVPTWLSAGIGQVPAPAALVVVGAEENTQVTVTLPRRGRLLADLQGRIQVAGDTVTFELGAQDVAILQADSTPLFMGPQPDLTGARIVANKAVAVFSSHECAYYPETMGACDHLEEQLFPVSTWGTGFVLVPAALRGAGASSEVTYWKIVARDVGTRVRFSQPFADLNPLRPGFDGVPACADMMQGDELVLGDEGFCEFGMTGSVEIVGDAPMMVMGIISGQEATGVSEPFGSHAGDPAIFLMPPARQFRDDYIFLAPDTYAFDYLTVVTAPGAQLVLDGAPVDLSDAHDVPGSGRIFKHIPISDGAHHVQGDQAFGIMVFAFDDFVSYAFTGGLNLRKR